MLESILAYLYQWLTFIYNKIVEWFQNLLTNLVVFLANMWTEFITWLGEVLQSIYNGVMQWVQAIIRTVQGVLTSLQSWLESLWNEILALTVGVLNQITNYASQLISNIRSLIESLVGTIQSWIQSIIGWVRDLAQSAINAIGTTVQTVRDTVTSFITQALQNIVLAYDQLLGYIQAAFQRFVGGSGSFIESIETRLSDLREAFGDAMVAFLAGLTELSGEFLGPIRDKVSAWIDDMSPKLPVQQVNEFIGGVEALVTGEAPASEYQRFLHKAWIPTLRQYPVLATIFFTMIGITSSAMLVVQLTGCSTQTAMQEFSKAFPYMILSPADATSAWRRGLIASDVAIDCIQKAGFTQADASKIMHLSDNVPAEQDIMVLWHRGLASEAEVDAALHQLGFSQEWADSLKQASYLIPPIGDIITMAVREAFSPEIAERFGQYEDFPEPFAHWARKQGLTEEWAKRYWAAHWALPSPQQGFEMLHRGVIGEEDLNLLLRALDVMPFWRGRLTQIAYAPFTRVDVRRMHKLGVLDDEDVKRAYLDLGYNQEKATLLTEFVRRLNAPPAADDDVALSELSRSAVLNFYGDGLLTRERAFELIQNLGYSAEAAGLYLAATDMDAERKERKDEISTILALAKAGIIDFSQAESQLLGLGLATLEVSRAMSQLVREVQSKTKIPSRSEAEKMYKQGVIDLKDYKEVLGILGYAPKWVDAFVSLIEGEGRA